MRNHMKSYEQAVDLINSLKRNYSISSSEDTSFINLENVTPETLSNYKIIAEYICAGIESRKMEYQLINGIMVCVTFSDGRYYTINDFIERLENGTLNIREFCLI